MEEEFNLMLNSTPLFTPLALTHSGQILIMQIVFIYYKDALHLHLNDCLSVFANKKKIPDINFI